MVQPQSNSELSNERNPHVDSAMNVFLTPKRNNPTSQIKDHLVPPVAHKAKVVPTHNCFRHRSLHHHCSSPWRKSNSPKGRLPPLIHALSSLSCRSRHPSSERDCLRSIIAFLRRRAWAIENRLRKRKSLLDHPPGVFFKSPSETL